MAVKARSEITLTRVDDGAKGDDGKMLYATSSTETETADKVATLSSGTLTLADGVSVSVKFTYGNTAASPTLNVNETGAKAIYTQGVRYAYWQAGATVVFVYDGTAWRVASEPVYANTVTIGNTVGQNVYIDSDSLDIRNKSNVLASFSSNTIELGKENTSAVIKMCGEKFSLSYNDTDSSMRILPKDNFTPSGEHEGTEPLNMYFGTYTSGSGDCSYGLNLRSDGNHYLEGNLEIDGNFEISAPEPYLFKINGVTLQQYLRDMLYPVGSIKMTTVNTNPSEYLGGTWVAWGSGKVPVGVNTSETEFATVEQTGGEKTHTLAAEELPRHSHALYEKYYDTSTTASTYGDAYTMWTNKWKQATISATGLYGSGYAHNNLQPYITCYMWKRTA